MSLLTSDARWKAFLQEMADRPDSRKVLIAEADTLLTATAPSVTQKKHLPPTKDAHDYQSLSPYWWPDPAKPDGLPWVSRDGEVNPLFYEYDSPRLESFSQAVIRLIFEAAVSGKTVYAEKAGKLLKTWFLDPNTEMNPHLQYAQFIPGITTGRGIGIIDATAFVFLLDAVVRLEFNKEWTAQDLAGLKNWMTRYLDWLLTSANGKEEGNEANNHGTWYDVQVACVASFCDKWESVKHQLTAAAQKRISTQIEPDGSQPHELKRTLSFTYCTFNLLGFSCVAKFLSKPGLNLWDWKGDKGGSILAALHWMIPYYTKKSPWTHQQLHPVQFSTAALLLSLAQEGLGDPTLEPLAQQLAAEPWEKISFSKASLTGRSYPKLAPQTGA